MKVTDIRSRHRSEEKCLRNSLRFFVFLLVILAFPLTAGAKTTAAKRYSLKDVTKAQQVEGRFVKKDGRGKFRTKDKKYIKNRWINYNGKIYYMDSEGGRVNGWVRYRNKMYFLRKCVLKVDTWFRDHGKFYYAGPQGYILKKQWIENDNKRYYVNADGERLTGEQSIEGKWYHFDNSGVMEPDRTVDPSKPMLALTFDDGPSPYTERLLNCFEKYHARGTFFMVGYCVANRPGTVRRMAALNCELGNHSDTHPHMPGLSSAQVRAQFSACSEKIRQAAGRYPTVCRLPYGAGHQTQWVLDSTGLPSIFWSCDTQDWKNTGNPSHTVSMALANAKDGAIIPMHDLHQSTVIACETIIPALIQRGYQLVTVSELARYRGNTTLQAGRTYYNFF